MNEWQSLRSTPRREPYGGRQASSGFRESDAAAHEAMPPRPSWEALVSLKAKSQFKGPKRKSKALNLNLADTKLSLDQFP